MMPTVAPYLECFILCCRISDTLHSMEMVNYSFTRLDTHPSIAAARLDGLAPPIFFHFIEVFWQLKKMRAISK